MKLSEELIKKTKLIMKACKREEDETEINELHSCMPRNLLAWASKAERLEIENDRLRANLSELDEMCLNCINWNQGSCEQIDNTRKEQPCERVYDDVCENYESI